jgi:hypothetical protein
MRLPASVRGIATAGALAGLITTGLAFAPALSSDDPATQLVTAADIGLDFAPRLLHVDAPTLAARNAVNALGLDVTEHASNDYVEVLAYSSQDIAVLRDAGFTWNVAIADLILHESQRAAADAAFAESVALSDLPSGRVGYRNLDDFGTDIDELVSNNGDIAKKISIGKSLEGRDLTGIEIGRDVNAAEDGRPVFLMFGVHHAREWPSAEMPMEFAIDLVNSYGQDTDDGARITDLLNRSRVIVVPVSNPDGYKASRESSEMFGEVGESLTPTNAYKRKNCRYVPGVAQPAGTCEIVWSPTGAGTGVDLNRNYGGLWGGPGADAEPSSAVYHGDAPFSEPETQAIRSLISTRQVTTLITNHTQGHLLLRPVGVAPTTVGPDGFPAGFAPDECFTIDSDGPDNGIDYGMQALGEAMTAQNGYSNQFGWELYDTTGTTEDYSYNATGGYGYTFELMNGSFHPAFANVIEEYTGTTSKAKALKALQGTADGQAAAEAHTSAAGADCAGDQIEHTTLGGGMRESYLIALENVVNVKTHSVLTGTASVGDVITVTRTGDFPLWDGSFMSDTVTTSMTASQDGSFMYHVNPSTRPFVSSRTVPNLSNPLIEIDESGATTLPPAIGSTDITVNVPAGAGRLVATLSSLALDQDDYDLELRDPSGNLVASAASLGSAETVQATSEDGLAVGTWTLTVINFAGVSPWTLTGGVYEPGDILTPETPEFWTVSCNGRAGIDVLVARGASADVGNLC